MKCGAAMNQVYLMDQELVDLGVVNDDCTALIQLECKLLDLGALAGLCSEVFYAFVFKTSVGVRCVRYFESSSSKGFMEQKCASLLQKHLGQEVLPYRYDQN